jgi:hypothetical protein
VATPTLRRGVSRPDYSKLVQASLARDDAGIRLLRSAWEAKIDRQGFGLWAVERAEDGALLGMAD